MNQKLFYSKTAVAVISVIAVVIIKIGLFCTNYPFHVDYLKPTKTHYNGIVIDNVWAEYKQENKNSCGAACLSFLLTKAGYPTTENEIYSYFKTEPREISYSDMEKYVNHRGLRTQSLQIDGNYFKQKPTMSILHFGKDHFVVYVQEKNTKEVLIFDPSYGCVFIPWKTLLREFDGKMFYIYQK